ncbi:MAG TPA: hypothetical protein VGB43_06755 [Flavobacterium sp.]
MKAIIQYKFTYNSSFLLSENANDLTEFLLLQLGEKKGELTNFTQYVGEVDNPCDEKEEERANDEIYIDAIMDIEDSFSYDWESKEMDIRLHILNNFSRVNNELIYKWACGKARYFGLQDASS